MHYFVPTIIEYFVLNKKSQDSACVKLHFIFHNRMVLKSCLIFRFICYNVEAAGILCQMLCI